MIKRALVAGAIFFNATIICSAEQMSDMRMVDGICEAQSHLAEGPIGADLSKRQSRYFCNAMILITFGPSKDHTLVQFAQKESHHGPIIGYAGVMLPGQNILAVDHIYLTQSVATPVTEGYCKFFYTATRLSSVACGAKSDEGSRRTVPIVAFDVAPGQ